jgi:hypothetical protein
VTVTEASGTEASAASLLDRRRAVAGLIVGALALAAAGFAIYRQRATFVATLKDVGIGTAMESFAVGLIGVGITFPVWWNVLDGLAVRLPYVAGARVFFISQLGKYIPGSVWPVVMQMEAGRAHGASRRTMLSANLITIVLGCCVGLVVACVLLPLYDLKALDQYWWVLVGLPFLLALLHPRALPAILDRAFVMLRRPPLHERLDLPSEARACGFALISWIALGGQLALLATTVAHGGLSVLILCIGAMALAVPLGVLFVPAPAGAGIRDVVLIVVLVTIMDRGQALAIVLASRVILIACDAFLAALVAIVSGSQRWIGARKAA